MSHAYEFQWITIRMMWTNVRQPRSLLEGERFLELTELRRRVGSTGISLVIKVNGSVDMAGDLHGVAGLAY